MMAGVWETWTRVRVLTAGWWLAASLAAGALLTWVTAKLAFVEFDDSQTNSPLAPLCLLGAAVAFLAAPAAIAQRRQRWKYLALVALAVVPIGLITWKVVWPHRRDF